MTNSNTGLMRNLRTAAVLMTLVFGTTACFHDDDPATSVTAEIGPLGGTLTAPDGTQVVIPAGALDETTTISVKLSSAGSPALPENAAPGTIYEFTPHDVVFNKPVTIRMPIPDGADGTEVLMASPGGEWQAYETAVTGGFAEWQRNSFSWGYLSGDCAISINPPYPYSSTNPDPYPCWWPRGAANATATPAQAITRVYSGYSIIPTAGSWEVTAASTVHLTMNYQAAPDCENGHVKLIRWKASDPLNTPKQTLFDQAVPLTQTPFPNPPGFGGTHIKAAGSTTVDVAFSHLDNGIAASGGTIAFHFTFSCNRPYRTASGGGDVITFVVSIPAPSVTYTIGGNVTGLTGTGLVLQNNGGDNLPVPADGPITFTTAIAAGAPYSVTVQTQPSGQTCTVQTGAGTNIQADVTNVGVSCVAASAAKAWQGAALLETLDEGDAFESQIAFDSSGNAMAVWSQLNAASGQFNVWARRYVPATGWGTAQRIQTDNSRAGRGPQIAFKTNGDAKVVWLQYDTAVANIWVASFTASTTSWGTATQLNTGTVGAYNPQIAVDSSDNAMVVWYEGSNAAGYHIKARRYVATASTWEAVQSLDSASGFAGSPQIAMDASGNAIAVWQQQNNTGTGSDIWANRFIASTGWGAATLIETNDRDALNPKIVSDAAGNMMAVWTQSDDTNPDTYSSAVYSNRFTAGNWGTASLVKSGVPYAWQSDIAMNANGDTWVVWEEDDGFDGTSIWARNYVAGVGGTALRIDDQITIRAQGPKIAIDASGNAVAVWQQINHIMTNRFVSGIGWGTPTDIDSTTAVGVSNNPIIASDSTGNAIAVWQRPGTASAPDLWTNLFK